MNDTPPPNSPPKHRPRWVIPALLVGAVIVLVGAVTAVFLAKDQTPHPTASATPTPLPSFSGPLTKPISFLPITDEYAAPCRPGDLPAPKSDAGRCLTMGTGLTVTSVHKIETDTSVSYVGSKQASEWTVVINLQAEDVKAFEDLTTQLSTQKTPPGRLAIVIADKVISAPQVMGPLLGGNFQIVAGSTESDARQLFTEITS